MRAVNGNSIRARDLVLLRGFTLLELLVVISLVSILVGLAVPSLTETALSSKLAEGANRLATSATMARSEAIKRNEVIKLCISANGTACTTTGSWEQGWILLSGTTTVLLYERAAPAGLKITELAGLNSLNFQATGVGSTQANFKVCRLTPSAGAQERVVDINVTGRTFVKRTTTGICA